MATTWEQTVEDYAREFTVDGETLELEDARAEEVLEWEAGEEQQTQEWEALATWGSCVVYAVPDIDLPSDDWLSMPEVSCFQVLAELYAFSHSCSRTRMGAVQVWN